MFKLRSNLAGSLAVVELFGQEFNPLQHGGLDATEQEGHTSVSLSPQYRHCPTVRNEMSYNEVSVITFSFE